MAASSAIIGKGTTLTHCATSGGSYVALSEVRDISYPSEKVGKVDVTHYTSDSSTMEYISAVWKEGDDVTFTVNYLKAQTTTLEALKGSAHFWKVVLPDGTYFFPGFITSFSGAIPNKEAITQTITIGISGPMTWTAS